MDPAAVTEKYRVPPERYSDLAALVGETSDNLPGVPGVGPKTAAKWLGQYGDLAGVVAHVDEITGKAGENLRAHLDGVLATAGSTGSSTTSSCRCPSTTSSGGPGTARRCTRSSTASSSACCATGSSRPSRSRRTRPRAGSTSRRDVFTADELAAGSARVHAGRRVPHGVVVVGHCRAGSGDAGAVALAGADGGAGLPRPRPTLDPPSEEALGALARRPGAPEGAARRQGAAAGAAGPAAPARGRRRATPRSPPTCAARPALLRPRRPRRAPPRRELRAEAATAGQGMLDFDGRGRRRRRADAMVRARAVLDLADVLAERARGDAAAPRCCATSSCRSSTCSRAWSAPASRSTSRPSPASRRTSRAKVRQAAARTPTTPSGARTSTSARPKQLQEVLFDQLGMPKTKRTKTGYTTDADALTDLYAKTEHPFLEALLAHRDASRLRVTVEGLLKSVAEDRRIHTTYIQTIAATGRLSSTDPNLQNVPIRTEEGRRIREVFVVGEGYESLMSADYSQIEMRIMAHLSGDEGLIEAFRSGEDLHRFVGCAGVRRRARGRHARDAQQGQGDELRPRLRPVGVRAVQAADDLHGRGAGPHGRVLRPVRRRARLPPRGRGRGARPPGTPRRCSAAGATCPTSSATTGSAARGPSGWRSTRRSRARRPTSSSSR